MEKQVIFCHVQITNSPVETEQNGGGSLVHISALILAQQPSGYHWPRRPPLGHCFTIIGS